MLGHDDDDRMTPIDTGGCSEHDEVNCENECENTYIGMSEGACGNECESSYEYPYDDDFEDQYRDLYMGVPDDRQESAADGSFGDEHADINTDIGYEGIENEDENRENFASQGFEMSGRKFEVPDDRGRNKGASKGFVIVLVIIGMLISTGIGAILGSRMGGGGKQSYDNLTSSGLKQSTKGRKSISQIVGENENSVVEVTTEKKSQSMFGSTEQEGAGSGVIVKKDGYIVTNNHVVADANSVSVRLHNGNNYSAQIVGTDAQNDIAVIKIDAKGLKAAIIGKSADLSVGDMAVAIGNPLGQLGGTATQGIISALDRKLDMEGQTLSLLQTDAAINPGNSGGGLFNGSGELVGIVDAKASGTGIEGLGFALPIDNVAPVIDDIIKNGHVTNRPALGITIYELSDEEAAYQGLAKGGVYIKDVKGEAAKKAGLKSGDRIAKFEGKEVENSNAFIHAVQSRKIGDKVKLEVEREGKSVSVTVTLEDSSKVSK